LSLLPFCRQNFKQKTLPLFYILDSELLSFQKIFLEKLSLYLEILIFMGNNSFPFRKFSLSFQKII